MTKFVAMLRGIGPGNPNMTGAAFKKFFEGLGFTDVQAVLASGNVIFSSPERDPNALAEHIEAELPKQLGYSRSVIIHSQADLQSLIDQDPFKGTEDDHNKASYLLITFFRRKPEIAFKLPHTPEGKAFTVRGKIDNAVYGTVDLSKHKTPDYMAWLEKQFGKDITSRTPKTIRLVLKRMGEDKF